MMGRVFRWDEIEGDRVPVLPSFQAVYARLKHNVRSQRAIVAAIACGSVVRNDHNVRSDLDVVVIYDHLSSETAFQWMRDEHAYATGYCVPISFIPCDTQIAATRLHHLGGSFVRHLKRSVEHGGNLKGDLFKLIAPSHSERDELESYLRVKMYKLQNLWAEFPTFSTEREVAFVQKALEAPMHIARKVLAHQGVLRSDAKADICAQYADLMPKGLSRMLMELNKTDVCYSAVLHEQIGKPNRHQYMGVLSGLRRHPPDVIDFVRQNLVFIAKATRT